MTDTLSAIQRTLVDAVRDTLGDRRHRNLATSDDANARRLVDVHGERIRWVDDFSSWITWDGRRWRLDKNTTDVRGLCRTMFRDDGIVLHAEAERERAAAREIRAARREGDDRAVDRDVRRRDDAAARLTAAAAGLGSASAIDNAARLAQTDARIRIRSTSLDRHPDLLNVGNGTIDLRTGAIRPHNPSDLMTLTTSVTYDPAATAPTWLAFLARVLPDPDVRDYFRRLVGYFLTGRTGEQIAVLMIGTGANGKSVATRTLARLLDEYHAVGTDDLVVAKRHEPHPTTLADLAGRRLVTISEIDHGARLIEARLKEITGGDRLKARRMREDFWAFDPSHKIAIQTNAYPETSGTDEGLWRRVRIIPFDVTIPADERDPTLVDKIGDEMPGVLAWAVAAATDYLRDGLRTPSAVQVATSDYRDREDIAQRFLDDMDYELVPGCEVDAKTLRSSFTEWIEATRIDRRLPSGYLTSALRSKGVTERKSGRRIFVGIRRRRDPFDV